MGSGLLRSVHRSTESLERSSYISNAFTVRFRKPHIAVHRISLYDISPPPSFSQSMNPLKFTHFRFSFSPFALTMPVPQLSHARLLHFTRFRPSAFRFSSARFGCSCGSDSSFAHAPHPLNLSCPHLKAMSKFLPRKFGATSAFSSGSCARVRRLPDTCTQPYALSALT
jgi:hypothetical protein